MLNVHTGGERDIGQWFKASCAGTIACIALYTLYGYILVQQHAGFVSTEMNLLIAHGMTPLVNPGDPFLTSTGHLVGSALFFGCTLGVLNALLSMAASVFPFLSNTLLKWDILIYLFLGSMCSFFSFSHEIPLVSIVFGFACPLTFFVPWIIVMRRSERKTPPRLRWAVLFSILCTPIVIYAFLGGSSFETIRDSLLITPGGERLTDFYYSHSPLAAHVIKPAAAREQNVLAVSTSIDRIGHLPHGTLWVRSQDPCSIPGCSMVVSREPLSCTSIVLKDSLPANLNNRIFKDYSRIFDQNSSMRTAIGLFLFKGPLLLIPFLILAWVSHVLASMFDRFRILTVIGIAAYILMYVPALHTRILHSHLTNHPEKIHEYILSEHEKKRYLALITYPDQFTFNELVRFATDSSSRIRLNALVAAGERKDLNYLPLFEQALEDTQLNVRTKACWGLGKIGSVQALPMIEKALTDDESWYVRGYAYSALGRIRPVSLVVDVPREFP
ncbi:MAG: HEAT repeat domain-containing protein [Desulfomonilia bacterium]